jgi:hypothetical protein
MRCKVTLYGALAIRVDAAARNNYCIISVLGHPPSPHQNCPIGKSAAAPTTVDLVSGLSKRWEGLPNWKWREALLQSKLDTSAVLYQPHAKLGSAVGFMSVRCKSARAVPRTGSWLLATALGPAARAPRPRPPRQPLRANEPPVAMTPRSRGRP